MIRIDDKEIRNPIEQIKKNMDDIEWLKQRIKDVYTANITIDTEAITVARENTNVPDNVKAGWLVDAAGNLFNITGGNTNTLMIKYYTNVKGIQGDHGLDGSNIFLSLVYIQASGVDQTLQRSSIYPAGKQVKVDDYVMDFNNHLALVKEVTSTTVTVRYFIDLKGTPGYSSYLINYPTRETYGTSITVPMENILINDRDVQVGDLLISDVTGQVCKVTAVASTAVTATVYGTMRGNQTFYYNNNLNAVGSSKTVEVIDLEQNVGSSVSDVWTVMVNDYVLAKNYILGQVTSVYEDTSTTPSTWYAVIKSALNLKGATGEQGPSGNSMYYSTANISSTVGNLTLLYPADIEYGRTPQVDDLVIDPRGYYGYVYSYDPISTGLAVKTLGSLKGPAGTYTAGDGINITNDEISIDNTVALKTDIPVIDEDLIPKAFNTYVLGDNTHSYKEVVANKFKSPNSYYEISGANISGHGQVNIKTTDGNGTDEAKIQLGNTGLYTNKNIAPMSGNTVNLGQANNGFNNLYLDGKIITDDNLTYGLQLPDTTNYTADKTLATTDQLPTYTISNVVTDQSDVLGIQVTDGNITYNINNAEANPTLVGTEATLGSIDIGGTYYKVITDYNDLSNKPTIPTVSDRKITLVQNGNSASFTLNQDSDKQITLPNIPTKTSDLTNDGSDNTSVYVEADELATVATSGDYDDLLNKPTIPSEVDTITLASASGTLSAADLAKVVDHPEKCYIKTVGWYLQLHEVTSTYITYANIVPAGSEVVKAQITISTGDYVVTSQQLTLKVEVNSTEYSPNVSGKITLPNYPDAVVANPTLAGTESNLTGLQVGSTKYKIPTGGGGSGVSDVQVNGSSVVTNNVAEIDLPNAMPNLVIFRTAESGETPEYEIQYNSQTGFYSLITGMLATLVVDYGEPKTSGINFCLVPTLGLIIMTYNENNGYYTQVATVIPSEQWTFTVNNSTVTKNVLIF